MNAPVLSIARFAKMCYRDAMPITIEALAAELAELRAEVRKPRKRKDRRRTLSVRLSLAELAIIDAGATNHGVCRSDFIRIALNQVLPEALPTQRKIPPGFDRMRVRYKTEHFDDGQTDHARNADAGRRALAAGLERDAIMRDLDGALAPAMRTGSPQGMLAEPRPTKFR